MEGHYFRVLRVEMRDKASYHLRFWELNSRFDFNEWEWPLFIRAWTLGQPALYVAIHRRLDLVDGGWNTVVCYYVMSLAETFTWRNKKDPFRLLRLGRRGMIRP